MGKGFLFLDKKMGGEGILIFFPGIERKKLRSTAFHSQSYKRKVILSFLIQSKTIKCLLMLQFKGALLVF